MSNSRSLDNLPFSSRTLWRTAWRYLSRHPWQSILMVIGITLGVAVVIAVDLANASAARAFDLSTEAVTGRTTHQIVAGPAGLDESVYSELRRQGLVPAAAPIIDQYASSPQLGDHALQLLGIDPFAEPPFRSYLAGEEGPATADLEAFLTRPGAILLSANLAARYELAPGDTITLRVAGREQDVWIAGLLEPSDTLSRRALEGILLADVATAQELTGRLGKLDRIDLILPGAQPDLPERIRAMLPAESRLVTVESRSGAAKGMTAAFRTNLTALSMLALFVGLFLIYNTMTFSVVQRRSFFGTLRCLGVTRREIFGLVLGEALLVGFLGAVLGLGLGILLGRGALHLVTQTINDLYFVLTVRDVGLTTGSLLKGVLLGIAATMLTAAPPAWEAASVPPRAALSRSGLEGKARQAVVRAAIGGTVVLAAAGGLFLLPSENLWISFAAISAVVLGFAMLTPLATNLLMGGTTPLLGWLWGVLGRMAPRDVVKSLSRTSVAVAALMVAMSVTIGIQLMIGSFRHTVVIWLEHAVQADIHVIASNLTARQDLNPVDPAVQDLVRQWPGLKRVELIRGVTVDSPTGPVFVEANTSPDYGEKLLYQSLDGSPKQAWQAVIEGAVLVSEPLANRLDLPRDGGTLSLYTDSGLVRFPVAGTYYEYASSEGTVIMALSIYRQHWNDRTVTALALYLDPGSDPDEVAQALRDKLTPLQRLSIRPNVVLRQVALEIFERTFAITSALQVLSTTVAFVGVLSALLSLQLERQGEFGILRAIGLTSRQLWALLLLETGFMGLVAGLLATPTGLILSWILVHVINRRSFGWTLQMQISAGPFLQALAAAVLAATLAGLYPAYRMSRMAAAEAMRFD